MFILTSHNDGSGSTLNAYDFPTFNAASEAMKEEIRDLYKEMHREYCEEDGEIYDDEAALELFGVMYEWKIICPTSEASMLGVSEESLEAAKAYADASTPETRWHIYHKGVCIVNPWMDPTGRFSLTTEQAIEVYGLKKMQEYISAFPSYKTPKAKIRDILAAYCEFDNEATEPGYVRSMLENCGMDEEIAKDLGFTEYFENEEDEEDY